MNREQLIKLCEAAIIQVDDWSNRDTPNSQESIGICWALLKAGCEFEILVADDANPNEVCVTDSQTIWLKITRPSFGTFDNNGPQRTDTFYLPTQERLNNSHGDWY